MKHDLNELCIYVHKLFGYCEEAWRATDLVVLTLWSDTGHKFVFIFGLASAGARIVLIVMVACCECGFDGASKWHWQMHQWVERHRCPFRFGCRNTACSSLHTLAEQAHKCTRQRLGQREWEAECGFCSVGLCKYGSACERTSRTVARDYDSNYEDDEDGWSVVGGKRHCAVRADRAELADGAGAMDGGRFELLVGAEMQTDEPDDGFFECDCDNAGFRFELRKERRFRQQERRKQNGQQRKGRTARKRVAAVLTATPGVSPAVNHRICKRICWLRAKLNRTGGLWREAIAHAYTCYGAQDGSAWRQLEDKMRMCLVADEQFWENAVKIQTGAVVLVYFGNETARMEDSLEQVRVHTKMAVDGKKDRFKAEKYAEKWKAGAEFRARQRQVGDKCWERIQQLPRQQRKRVEEDEDYAREMGLHIQHWLDEDAARGATRH